MNSNGATGELSPEDIEVRGQDQSNQDMLSTDSARPSSLSSDPTQLFAEPTGPSAAALRQEAAEFEYQALVNERSHFEAANLWQRIYTGLGVTVAALGVVTAGSLAAHFGDQLPAQLAPWAPWVTGLASLMLATATAVSNFLDPKGQRDMHLAVGKRYSAWRNELRQFRTLQSEGKPLHERLNELTKKHEEIHAAAPSVTDRWHKRAKRKLASNVHYRTLRSLTGRPVPGAKGTRPATAAA